MKKKKYDYLYYLNKLNNMTQTEFCYDYCFSDKDDNKIVYENVVKRVALSSLNGINGTIFMYG